VGLHPGDDPATFPVVTFGENVEPESCDRPAEPLRWSGGVYPCCELDVGVAGALGREVDDGLFFGETDGEVMPAACIFDIGGVSVT
jgi:hypothetical protein